MWCKEAWNYVRKVEYEDFEGYEAVNFYHKDGYVETGYRVIYKADPYINRDYSGWRSPLHIPKAYARIWREITEVRIERVQEISKEDCIAEGIDIIGRAFPKTGSIYIDSFLNRGNEINESRGYSWDDNPWVIALTLKEIE